MVLASIGTLQTTIMDRSVAIPLERKTPDQSVETNPHDIFDLQKETREKLLKWSIDNKESIETNPIAPDDIGNARMVDNWTPLFTLANQVSPAWFIKCQSAYVALTTIEDEAQLSNIMLSDIREIFNTTQGNRISSEELLSKLKEIEEHPWEEIRLSKHGIALQLKLYGIKPKGIRIGGSTPRGYELSQFNNAFESYLPQQ